MRKSTKTDDSSLRRLSLHLSVIFVCLWVAAISLALFGGPFWLQVVLGLLGLGVALADRKYIRQRARATFYNEAPDQEQRQH
ncbi:hypothetical protein KAK06_06400 [Ideonella sp. 4Y11]|uniref:Uncharacterized protein n=1 Tax=Ideonella aquatica TaxID=2824119 RepID=A0A941BFB5_9BURK|nr:hypothetical protein [Ideonella aquatica]MBQ0958586.1 hypothetical protein [Ideonella aquatica]